jgi:7-cyano-7-deazaguanine synthase in queuosine biosynthesis
MLNRHQATFKKRKFEDLTVIKSIESIFLKKRKSIFQLPKPGTEVILLVSGGLDSILSWGLLMDSYKLKVYPLFLNKGEKRASQEEKSVDFFSQYYAKKYPALYVQPEKQTIFLPTPFDNLSIYNKKVTKDFSPTTTTNIFLGSPGIVPLFALLHARYLELTTTIKIRTIFSSVMMGDGTVCPSQSLTSLRTINLAMCTFTGDYSWQFTSASVEPILQNFFEKKDLIKWATEKNIPMEHTWSCYRGLKHQCGVCLACNARMYEFKRAKVKDPTIYMSEKDLFYRKAISVVKLFRRFLPIQLHFFQH